MPSQTGGVNSNPTDPLDSPEPVGNSSLARYSHVICASAAATFRVLDRVQVIPGLERSREFAAGIV